MGGEKTGEQRQSYIADLEKAKSDLETEMGKTPISIGNKHKRWRMQADITQYQWRIDYLRQALN